MFRKTRQKIVAVIMAVLACLFLGTLAVIYISSYFAVSNANFEMLEHHAQMYVLPGEMEGGFHQPPREPVPGKPMDTPAFRLSTFYTVAVARDGQILATDMGDRAVYSSQTLEAYAADILKSGKPRGVKGSLVYLVVPKNGYTLVAFMDNTVIHESMMTLFRYTLVFGSGALAALFFLSRYLAGRIVDPLEKSYLKQKRFVSDAGHELKTPVSVISANSDILHRELGDNPWLANIRHENERMGQLVGQLLELARTEDVKPKRELLDFSRLAAGGVLPFESVAFENGLELNTRIPEGITLMGNGTQLSQLVSILVDNAIRHSQGGREVRVCLAQSRSTVIFSVINTAAPIPREKQKLLFERFYRVDEARTGEDNHYGLGLSIAKAVVEAHRGRLEVCCRDGLVEFSAVLPKG